MNLHVRTIAPASFLVCALAFLAPPTSLAQAPAPPKKLSTVEGITEYSLDNGMRILLAPDASTPTVTVDLVVFVGSRLEGYGETGMAHLLEHMLFKGTPQHPHVPQVLKEHGANFNGTTWVDRTNYFETMPATDENLEFGISLEADRLINSYVRAKDLRKEMTVVRNEFEMGENNPSLILSQRMLSIAYEWHNYGKSTIGNLSDIERVPIERLQTFYHKYYQPDNAMLIVGGKFDQAKALASIAREFGAIKRPERKLEAAYTEEPPQDGERSVHLRRVGTVGTIGAVYHVPAAAHEDFAALEVLTNILTADPAGRLYKALVVTRKATNVTGTAYAWHDPGVVEFFAQVDPKGLADARATMLDVLEDLSKQPFTTEEVERAKRQLLKEEELLMTNNKRVVMELGEWQARGDWRLFFLHRDRIGKVMAEDVARVAGRYLLRNNRTAGLFIPTTQPERSVIPETPVVAELVKDYKGGAVVAAGEEFVPTAANIEKRVERSQLSDGLKMALLPKKTRGESVTAHLTLRFGSEQALKGHTSAAQLLGPLMARGTKMHNHQQIQDELDRLGARLVPMSSAGELTFMIEAKRSTLPAVLQLLGEILRQPTFPAAEFDILKRETRDTLEKGLTEPTALAFREIQRRLAPYPPEDVRYVPTIEESISRLQAVTPEEVRNLYTEQVGAQDGQFALVGDFDAKATAKLVTDLLGGWKANTRYQRIARPAKTDVPGARQEILTPDKANAVYVAGEMLDLVDTDPDYPALTVANFLFGGGPLASRLANRVRQKEGLSYGIRSQFNADAQDKAARLVIFAICKPTNIGKVDSAILEELDKLLKDGIDREEATEAQKSFLEQEKVQRASDTHLAAMLSDELFNGRTFAYYAELEKKIGELTPEQIISAWRKHIVPGKLIIVEAGDFHKKGTK